MNKNMLRAAVAATLATVASSPAWATNGYQLIGVGTYQKSLAGAVTAAPGSAMTAVTNPAGMAVVGNRADFSMEGFMPDRSVDFTGTAGEKQTSQAKLYGVPALGWTAQTSDNSDVYFGGGMYGTSGMGVDYAPTKMMVAGGTPVYWDGYSNIAFWQMAPTLAWKAGNGVSLGASINLDYQQVAFRQRTMLDTAGAGTGDTVYSNFDLGRGASGFGFGITVGGLVDVADWLTLGASYKSKQNFAPLEYQLAKGDITDPTLGAFPAGTYKLDLDFPQQLALGLALKPADWVTISADVKWINWADTMKKLKVDGPGSWDMPMDPHWDDQYVYAIGVAFKAGDDVNLRAGYNYASSPFGNGEVSRNLILPAVVESHFAFGGDVALNRHWQVGLAYMYVPKKSFAAPATDTQAPNAKVALSEQSVSFNIGYRF